MSGIKSIFRFRKALDIDTENEANLIAQSVNEGIVILDKKGTISLYNEGMAQLTGWAREDSMGLLYKSVLKFVDKNNQPLTDILNPFVTILKDGKDIISADYIIARKDNVNIPIKLSLSKLNPDIKSSKELIGVFRDVNTAQKIDKERSDFISTASHEMRTPIASIEGFISLALLENKNVKVEGYLNKAHEQIQKLGKLFEDLLTGAQVDEGAIEYNPIEINLNELILSLVPNFKRQIEERGLQFELNMSNDSRSREKTVSPIYYIKADPKHVTIIINQLVSNAMVYTYSGWVIIGLRGTKDSVEVYIQDTGKGIDKVDIPHLFQKFYRVDNSKTRDNGGTGLGLFIAKSLADMNNAKIVPVSTLGQGSVFYVIFPRLKK
ncbi:MAG: ATP-binding protein [bacterium]